VSKESHDLGMIFEKGFFKLIGEKRIRKKGGKNLKFKE